MVWSLQIEEGETHFSCEMAGTRRWEVCRPERRVRDCTSERRMASFGLDCERVVTAPTGERMDRRRAADGRRVSRCMAGWLVVACRCELMTFA